MSQNKNTLEFISGQITSFENGDRNISIPAGEVYHNVEIKSENNPDIVLDNLYIIDSFDIEKASDFRVINKHGKYLLVPNKEEKDTAIESFKNYYLLASKDAIIFLYLPIFIISVLLIIFLKEISMPYMVIVLVAFIIRQFVLRILGDLFLIMVSPSYLYLLIKFF